MTITINDKLYKDIDSYCKLNDLGETVKYINDLLKKSFMVEKYGEKPSIQQKESVEVKKEETEVVDGGIVVEVVENKKPEELEKVEIEEDFDYKKVELNKVLKDGVFNDELSDKTPVIEKKPKKHKLK